MYYGDTKQGAPTITVTPSVFAAITQTETITATPAKLVFTTAPVMGNAYTDANIGPITVTEETSGGIPTTVGETVNLSSSSPGTYVFNTALGATTPTGNTSVTIPNGQSSVTFYYGDTKFGTPTITAAATGLTSATQVETINVGPVASFALSNPGSPTAGTSFNETITALDAGGNTVTGYGSTQTPCLTFTSPGNSPNGTAPLYPGSGTCPSGSSVTFTNGVGTAPITLYDAETTTLQATSVFITGTSASFTVNPAAASGFALATPSPSAGTAFSETVTATDAYGNTATSYGGTGGQAKCITFTGPSKSPNNTAPAYPAKVACTSGSSVTFTSGIGTAAMTLYDAQTTTLTATTTAAPTLTGTSASFTVTTAALATLTVANPGTQTAGQPFNVTITGADTYGNGFAGTVTPTFSGPSNSPNGNAPAYPSTVTFANGQVAAPVTLFDAQTTTLKVTVGTINNTSTSFKVNAAGVVTLTATSGANQSAKVTTAFSNPLVATATDTYGNAASGITVTFAAPSSLASATFTACSSNPQTYSCTQTTSATGQATSSTFTANGTIGGYTITASAAGLTATYTESNTATPTNVVTNAPAAPTFGQSVTYTATVTGPAGGPTPTGAVTWTLTGPVTSCASTTGPTGTTNVATYTCVITASGAGSYTAKAAFAGDTNYSAVTSNTDSFTVAKATPTNVVTNAPASPTLGQSVTYTATVTGPAGGATPTGAVTWTLTGPVTSSASTTGPTGTTNVATYTCVITASGAGSYTAKAAFAADTNYSAVTSNTVSLTVAKATPTNVVSNAPAAPTLGNTVTYTATVTGPAGGATQSGAVTWTLTGPVTSSASTTGPTGTTNVATYTCVIPASGAGSYTGKAAFAADTNYAAVTSNTDSFTVATATPTNVVTNVPANPTPGQSVTFTATVTGPTGATPPTGGTVTWTVSGTAGTTTCLSFTVTLNTSSQATCTLTVSNSGTYVVSDSWNGNTNYNSAASANDTVTLATQPIAVALANGTGTAGKIDQGDSATVTFNGQLNATTVCSAWTGAGTKTLANATITFTHSGSNDTFAATSASCTGGGGNFGTVVTGANYVTNTSTFRGSTITWNPATDKLTFTLGTLASQANRIRTGVTAGFPGYTASGSVTDTSGNAISTTTFTSTTTSGF